MPSPLPSGVIRHFIIEVAAEAKVKMAVVGSYLKVMPLLWEREAIAAFVEQSPELMTALPNLEDAEEAVMVATMDYRMDESQQKQLPELLQTPPK